MIFLILIMLTSAKETEISFPNATQKIQDVMEEHPEYISNTLKIAKEIAEEQTKHTGDSLKIAQEITEERPKDISDTFKIAEDVREVQPKDTSTTLSNAENIAEMQPKQTSDTFHVAEDVTEEQPNDISSTLSIADIIAEEDSKQTSDKYMIVEEIVEEETRIECDTPTEKAEDILKDSKSQVSGVFSDGQTTDKIMTTELALQNGKKFDCKAVIKTNGRRMAKFSFLPVKTLLLVSFFSIKTIVATGLKFFQWGLFYHPVLSIGALAAMVAYWHPALILAYIIVPFTAMWDQYILPWLQSLVEQVLGPPLTKIGQKIGQDVAKNVIDSNVCPHVNSGMIQSASNAVVGALSAPAVKYFLTLIGQRSHAIE